MTDKTRLGKYDILEELGRGGFGVVYKAHDLALDRIVAVKVLHPNLVNDSGFVSRFRNEARLAAQFDHPNIVPVHDFGESEGLYYIVMGYMPGGSLKEMLQKEGALPEEKALAVLKQVSDGLSYAHRKGIIHRDLKPGNILFDEDGEARISDLGFAKALYADSSVSLSVSGGMVGTPAYMAPEVWRSGQATERSDIYSLGCILYEILTGDVLFEGQTPAISMTKHLIDGPQFKHELSNNWLELLNKCLAMDPGNRYPRVDLILDDYSSNKEKLEQVSAMPQEGEENTEISDKEEMSLNECNQEMSSSDLRPSEIIKTKELSQEQCEEVLVPDKVQEDIPSLNEFFQEVFANTGIEDVEKKENLWTFGTKQLGYAVIGVLLNTVITWLFDRLQISGVGIVGIYPVVVIPMFFGIAFGPIVGFITGSLSTILLSMLSGGYFWIWGVLISGIKGLIPGLFSAKINKYNETRSILIGEISVVLSSSICSIVRTLDLLWHNKQYQLGLSINEIVHYSFLPTFLTYLIWGLILLPVLMIVYAKVVQRRNDKKEGVIEGE